jgi:hypothetical protein
MVIFQKHTKRDVLNCFNQGYSSTKGDRGERDNIMEEYRKRVSKCRIGWLNPGNRWPQPRIREKTVLYSDTERAVFV